ncbi:hypothetical protein DW645_00830 [Collinsella sp. AM23-17]|uniref:Uncharacterized protein n=1 Tax=Collinsella aerofaciens TaxID=74426 RepID=A0A2D1TX80_9ACTN|nr:hypothetical protein CSV91_04875 [Collinsella aerofaciens]RGU44141.1 hypothetical protein DWW73_00940 [Collinsella sp. AF16-8]RHG00436.1 hypothetical protein DW645_00830 [Collinsella sp. AM23-17]
MPSTFKHVADPFLKGSPLLIVHTRTALRMVVAIPMTAGTNVEIARAGYAGESAITGLSSTSIAGFKENATCAMAVAQRVAEAIAHAMRKE